MLPPQANRNKIGKSIAPFDVPGALYFCGFDSEAVGGPVVRDPKFRGAAR